eukprot:403861-Hanusia_phi.AAC.6
MLDTVVQLSQIVNGSYRRYIDIDEDTVFVVSRDVLWIDDVDSDEAALISSTGRRHCCQGNNIDAVFAARGCFCGQPCLCTSGLECPCPIPSICNPTTEIYPGEIIVELSVEHGFLSFYPPPGRDFLAGLVFLTNSTQYSFEDCAKLASTKLAM